MRCPRIWRPGWRRRVTQPPCVLGQVGVQLQGGHAQRQSVCERGEGLLGPFAAAAAVDLQVEGVVVFGRLDGGLAVPAAFDDGVPAPFSGGATAGLAMAAIRAAAATAVRIGRMGGSSWDEGVGDGR